MQGAITRVLRDASRQGAAAGGTSKTFAALDSYGMECELCDADGVFMRAGGDLARLQLDDCKPT